MIRKTLVLIAVLAIATASSIATVMTQSRSLNAVVVYEGARLIPGDAGRPIESGAMLVENGVITKVGAKGSVNAPGGALRVDLAGKTIMPTLINTHGHPGF